MEDHALEDHALEDHAMEDHAMEDHAMEYTKEWEYYQNGLVLYGYSYLKTYCIQRRQTQPTSFVQSALFQRILHDVVRQLHVHRHPICHALPKENNKRAGWLIQHIVRVYYNLPFARSRDLARFRKLLGWLKQLAPKDGYSHLSACASAADNQEAVVAACVAADASLADEDASACAADACAADACAADEDACAADEDACAADASACAADEDACAADEDACAADNEDASACAADACAADEDLEVLEHEVPTKKSWWLFW